ncbi:MAG: hypothetical protein LLF76_00800 [Planctomycetaceae bacterium]|nr:hypothetical protein [Planctomycetaceae bacterium]
MLAGFNPFEWNLVKSVHIEKDDVTASPGAAATAEIRPIPAAVPGSVQKALLDAAFLPDWNYGLNARLCEWVENRHWIYEARIPDEWLTFGKQFRLRCLGLDYCGSIRLNFREILRFKNSHLTYTIDLTGDLQPSGNVLQVVFECPPRWLGQFGWTSKMTDWKPRFNYFWDWTSRLVQIGIWDGIYLEAGDAAELQDVNFTAGADPISLSGQLAVTGKACGPSDYTVEAELSEAGQAIQSASLSLNEFNTTGLCWDALPIKLWYPNGLGEQPLYTVRISLKDPAGHVHDVLERRIGFRHIEWHKCEDSRNDADPWLSVCNGEPFFLQGANWTPIRPNFADVSESEYRKRLELYRDLGFNIVRVWGGAFLEKECFYDLCDELGILVWQEFPVSSSGFGDSNPPTDDKSIEELTSIARSFIERRRHHASLILWSGGNELQEQGSNSLPITINDKLITRFAQIVREMDPGRRFLTSSPSGPSYCADAKDFGKQVHWDVHGPWKAGPDLEKDWRPYWQKDDALFRSETGAPGPCSVELIRKYKGDSAEFPCSVENPLWRRAAWWTEWSEFIMEKGRLPRDLDEYVAWGQARQAKALSIAVKACKDRFPRCGGIIIWMGHDSYPCPANTSIIDFEGNPKPAALAIGEIFRRDNSKN